MTRALAAGNFVQLRIWAEMPAAFQAGVNSCWYVVSSVGASAATDSDFATVMDGVLAPVYKPALNNSANYKGVQAIIHSPTPPYPALALPAFSIAGFGAGTGGAVPMPKQVTAIIGFLSDRPGPSGRGRIYVPFPPQDGDNGSGAVSGPFGLVLDAIGNELEVGRSLSVGGRSAVLVRAIVHGPDKDGVYPLPSGVTDHRVDGFWATQKRRGSFGRQNFSPI